MAGIIWIVSVTGRNARRGASRWSASAMVPRWMASITTKDWPRRWAGRSGAGGKFISRAEVVNSSGRLDWVSWRQACSTSAAASAGHHSSPA